jgi:hypothetical protein
VTRARDNPFCTNRVLAVRYRPQGWTWLQLYARLEAMNYCGAIVGPKGSGKTTLLEDLRDHFESTGRPCRLIRLSRDRRRVPASSLLRIAEGELVLLDGAEQLNFMSWARFRNRALDCAAGLVITTHTPGRLPTLLETFTSPALLDSIVADLLPTSRPSPERVRDLFTRHRGNLRDALRELYDDLAGIPEQAVTMDHWPNCVRDFA